MTSKHRRPAPARRTRAALALAGAAAAALTVAIAAPGSATVSGTWAVDAYPGQAAVYQTSVGQPINADGSSNFKATSKGVVPVKFDLATGTGAFRFESIGSDNATDNDYSYVSFTPPSPTTLSQLTTLTASYKFTDGNCHGGSMRWAIHLAGGGSVSVYYGDGPNFTDCTTTSQSGDNLRAATDARVDTTQLGGAFYDTWANLVAGHGGDTVTGVSLVLDGGWGGDQQVNLTSATVNDTTFTPDAAVPPAPTCELPAAQLQVEKTSGANSGTVNEPVSIQAGDDNGVLRVVDCHYMYNLALSSLTGPGTYQVSAVIGGTAATGAATFQLR